MIHVAPVSAHFDYRYDVRLAGKVQQAGVPPLQVYFNWAAVKKPSRICKAEPRNFTNVLAWAPTWVTWIGFAALLVGATFALKLLRGGDTK